MTENHRDQIMVLQDSKKIEEKLLLLSIYNELYSALRIVYGEDIFKKKLEYALSDTFDKTLISLELSEKCTSAVGFFYKYIDTLKDHDILSILKSKNHLLAYLDEFQNNLKEYERSMKYVDIVDASDDLDLYTKTDLICLYRNKVYKMQKLFNFLNVSDVNVVNVFNEAYYTLYNGLLDIINNIEMPVDNKNKQTVFIDEADEKFSRLLLEYFKEKCDDQTISYATLNKDVQNVVLRVFKKEDINFFIKKLIYNASIGDNENNKMEVKKDLCADLSITSIKYFILSNDFDEANKILGYVRKNQRK